MKKFLTHKIIQTLFLLILTIFAAATLNAQTVPNSENESKPVTVTQTDVDNSVRAFDELALMDKLILSKEREIFLLKERIVLEQEKSKLALDIADARKNEAGGYKAANESLLIAIASKDSNIKNLEKEVETLKKKKSSLFKRILDIAAGIGVGILLR